MKAEDYATKNAKTPEEVFSLYHAYKTGEQNGMETKMLPVLIIGFFLGVIVTTLLVVLKLIVIK